MKEESIVAVLENPNFIINIGTVIRNINGLGIDQLIVIDGLNRLENDIELIRQRKSILKHSNGAVKWTSIQVFKTTKECTQYLRENRYESIGTTPHNKCKNQIELANANLTAPKLAIWFGNESSGLSCEAINNCQSCITIKMRGKVESFNLSITTGIVLFEAMRQRD